MFSIDHEIKAKYMKIIGHRNMSNDVEEYMKSRVEEYEKIKNIVAPDQGTTNNSNSASSNFNSNSNLKSVTIQQEKENDITLDVLNDSKIDLSLNIDKIDNKTVMCKIKANAHMVETIANTRIQRMRMS